MSYATHPLGEPFDDALADVNTALAAYQANLEETAADIDDLHITFLGSVDYGDGPEHPQDLSEIF